MKIVKREGDANVIYIGAIFRELLRQFPIIFCVTLAFAVAGYTGLSMLRTPVYTAKSTIFVNNTTDAEATMVTMSDLSAAQFLAGTVSVIMQSNTVCSDAVEQSGYTLDEITPAQLSQQTKYSILNQSQVIQIEVSNADAMMAQKLADTLAEVAVTRIPEVIEGSSVRIVDTATVPLNPDGLSSTKLGVLCAFAGLFLSALGVLLAALFNDKIESESDFEEFGYPLLGMVPDLSDKKKASKKGGK